MKIYILIFVVFAAAVWGAYYTGTHVTQQRCRADAAINAMNLQTNQIKYQEEINAETFTTAVADIRGKLREKYTIAD